MSEAREIVTTTESPIGGRSWTNVKAECSECGHMEFTGIWTEKFDRRRSWIAGHLAQHEPGRALDIAVDWEPLANCSVCADGIGDIEQEDEGLVCQECGTSWNLDGTGGTRDE